MKRPLIVGNWKLYIDNLQVALDAAKKVARGVSKVDATIWLSPPSPFLHDVYKAVGKSIAIGSQSVSYASDPKNTGEVSGRMVKSVGGTFTLVGHSERRAKGQSDVQVMEELQSAIEAKLNVILCIGEKERDQSGSHFAAIETQLRQSLPKLAVREVKQLIIAYEPLWAIGKTAADAITPEVLEETALYIRKVLADCIGRKGALTTPILYGGSVEPENAEALMRSGVAGFLVGHASVDPSSLILIAKAAHTAHAS